MYPRRLDPAPSDSDPIACKHMMTSRFKQRPILWGTGILLFAGILGAFLLHQLGSRRHWELIADPEALEGEEVIDSARLTDDGEWLIWTDSHRGLVRVMRLGDQGAVGTFRTHSHLRIEPTGVMENHLFVLRTSPDRGLIRTMLAGFDRLFGLREGGRSLLTPESSGGVRSTHLEGLDLDSGTVKFRYRGASTTASEFNPLPTGFEMGRVSQSPDGRRLAWWRAEEVIRDAPVSATVTETFEIFEWEGGLRPVAGRPLRTPGYIETWSGIMKEMGRPMWVGPQTCFFLSFLNGGSLVPVDPQTGEFAATITLEELFGDQAPGFIPEGLTAARGLEESGSDFLFWGRNGDTIRFIRFDKDYEFVSERMHEAGDIDFASPLWLSGGDLLLRERSTGRFRVLSDREEKGAAYPAAAFPGEEFQVLGRDSRGNLIALSDSKFWSASRGGEAWSELIPTE